MIELWKAAAPTAQSVFSIFDATTTVVCISLPALFMTRRFGVPTVPDNASDGFQHISSQRSCNRAGRFE
jgi:hypothetical protein